MKIGTLKTIKAYKDWFVIMAKNVGWVTLEIDGEEVEYSKALSYLDEVGVIVEPVERNVIE